MVFYSLREDYIGQHDVGDQYHNNMLKYKQPYQILFESVKLVQKWWAHNHNIYKKNSPQAPSSQAI